MRFRSTFARAALLGAVLPSTVLAACGSNEDDEVVAVDTWVRSLCSAAARFDIASDEAGDAFVEAVDESPDDTAAIKEGFAESIELQKEAQKTFRDEFGELGKPDVDDPDAVIKAFRDQFEENDERTDRIARDIEAISDDEDFFEAFAELEIEDIDFRSKLEPLAEDDEGVQQIIDEIEANEDCAATLFDAEPTDPEPEPTTSGGNTTPAPTVNASPRSQAWASGVCGSLLDWVTDLENANTDLQFDAEAASNAEDLKQVLVRFLEQGLADTEDFQAEIDSLTAPDVGDGEDIHRVFTGVAEDLVILFEDFVFDANNIDASSLNSVAADLEGFEQRVGTAFDEVGAAFNELDQYDPEGLDILFATLPECTALSQ